MDTYIYLLITMAFSAFFSGMEIAFVSVDKLRFEMERKEGLTSRILSYFFRNSNNFISTMLVGNNIALVIYGILMAQVIKVHLLGDLISNDFVEVLLQTVISTLIILVTGEFLPKTLFKINPNLVLKVCAFPLLICYIVLYPVSQLASGLSYLFLRLFGMKINKEASDKAFGKVDLDYFVQSSIDNAEDEEELDAEVKIFQNALDFSVGYKRQDLTFVYVKDIVQAIFLGIEKEVSRRAYFLSDGKVYKSRAFSDLIQKELGDPFVIHIKCPLIVLKVVSLLAEFIATRSGKSSTLNSDKYKIMKQRNWQCDITPAVKELGYAPEYDLEKGVKETIAWYKNEGWL